jgi:hypothetical protein
MKGNVTLMSFSDSLTWKQGSPEKSQITNPKSQKKYNDSNSNIQTVHSANFQDSPSNRVLDSHETFQMLELVPSWSSLPL